MNVLTDSEIRDVLWSKLAVIPGPVQVGQRWWPRWQRWWQSRWQFFTKKRWSSVTVFAGTVVRRSVVKHYLGWDNSNRMDKHYLRHYPRYFPRYHPRWQKWDGQTLSEVKSNYQGDARLMSEFCHMEREVIYGPYYGAEGWSFLNCGKRIVEGFFSCMTSVPLMMTWTTWHCNSDDIYDTGGSPSSTAPVTSFQISEVSSKVTKHVLTTIRQVPPNRSTLQNPPGRRHRWTLRSFVWLWSVFII